VQEKEAQWDQGKRVRYCKAIKIKWKEMERKKRKHVESNAMKIMGED
jgi:hypothetical protein